MPRIPGIPSDYPYHPDAFGMAYEDLWLTTPDGLRLHAWLMWPAHWGPAQRRARPTLVFFQENAGNMAFRLPFLKSVTRFLDCSAFIVSYRGYGRSQGAPSERGLQLDAHTALDHLLARADIDAAQLVLMGRSLGGAVAIYAATQYKGRVRGVIVENTFTNLEEAAPGVLPVLRALVGPGRPCNFLLRNKWYSDRRVAELADVSMLFLSSLADEMLQPAQMAALFRVHGRHPWHFVPFEGARHMDAYETHAPQYWPVLRDFMASLDGGPAAQQQS